MTYQTSDRLKVLDDGGLYDTRIKYHPHVKPIRAVYKVHTSTIDTLAQVKASLRAGQYTTWGMYPLYFVTRDGGALSFEAVRECFDQVCWDFMNDANTGWRIEALTINHEDTSLYCDHTGQLIPSACGD